MNIFKKLFGVSQENKAQTLEDKTADDNRNFDILKYDGVKALNAGHNDYALECFDRALAIKEDLDIRDYMSRACIALGDLPNAYRQLQKLADARPDNINIFLRMAHVAYMMEDYVVMGTVCEKALLIDKDSCEALYLYAQSCNGTGDSSNAVAMLTKAVSLKDEYADAYLLRGEINLDDGNLEAAGEDAAWLIDHFPENEDALMLQAKIELARNSYAEAIKYFDGVIGANPFRLEAYSLRGEARRNVGDEEGAKADLEYAAKLHADSQSDDAEGK